jgi:hypothetical protein
MKTLACVVMLGLAGLLAACGADSGGAADPFVGTWRLDAADFTAKSADSPMPPAFRDAMIEKFRYVIRADGTYAATVPDGFDDDETPRFAAQKGTWSGSGGTYTTTEDGKPDAQLEFRAVGSHLEFQPKGVPVALRLVRA